MKHIYFGLISIFLVSCAGAIKQSSPTFLPTNIATVAPTSTRAPTANISPTPTAESIQSVYSLPAWMRNPSTNILAAFVTDDYKYSSRISFYNAATKEKYDLKIPEDVCGYFWYDDTHFGFLTNDLKSLALIDLSTGQTSTNALPPESLRLWNLEHENYSSSGRELMPLEIIRDNTDSRILLKSISWVWDNTSKNMLFTAGWDVNLRNTITVTDTTNKQTVWEFKFPTDFYGTEFAWSPTDENRLAFIQGKPVLNNDTKMTSMKLNIVDVVNQKTLWAYDGDFGRIAWSPDGKKILYLNHASRYNGYGVAFQDAPCILFVEAGIKRCLRSIPRLVPAGFNLGITGHYEWAPDNESIFYTYEYYRPSSNEYKPFGNLCIYSLVDGRINCPTQNLEVLNERSISGYEVSPDRQFIYFCYSDSSLLSDMAGNSNNAVIRSDGTGFFSWPGTKQDGGPNFCSPATLWRPLP